MLTRLGIGFDQYIAENDSFIDVLISNGAILSESTCRDFFDICLNAPAAR
jgi:hypothetical protein